MYLASLVEDNPTEISLLKPKANGETKPKHKHKLKKGKKIQTFDISSKLKLTRYLKPIKPSNYS